MENYDIFISYKRRGASNYVSSYIYSFLKDRGYSVFLDREEMGSGEFNKQIYEHIQNATDVIVLLEEGSLKSITDGFSSEQLDSSENASMFKKLKTGAQILSKHLIQQNYKSDWFCMEIMRAIETEKNIIPVLLNNYKMPNSKIFPKEMKKLAVCQAIDYDYRADFNVLFSNYFIEKKYLKSEVNNQLTQIINSISSKIINKE